MNVLTVNAGSSSLKLRVLGHDDAVLARADLPPVPEIESLPDKLARLLGGVAVSAVGHRIVHGGTVFHAPVRVDGAVRAALTDLVDLAPLHQPKSLAALDAVTAALPDLAAVACFDTAYHATIPAAAATYAVPAEWRSRWGVRRYGFHGLSHAYCARRSAQLLGRGDLRTVVCHLGAGASLTAVVDGRSVDTTMGFTPLEGLVMATRSGSIDPGLLLWLEEHERIAPHELANVLENRSGLLALCGTADMRVVEQRALAGDEAARLAFDVFVHRLVTSVGAMAAAAGGVDALVFTGGIGENSATVRGAAAERLAWLGVAVDERRPADGDRDVSADGVRVRTLVIAAREDVEIARETRAVLAPEPVRE